jgi:hypothetical protein
MSFGKGAPITTELAQRRFGPGAQVTPVWVAVRLSPLKNGGRIVVLETQFESLEGDASARAAAEALAFELWGDDTDAPVEELRVRWRAHCVSDGVPEKKRWPLEMVSSAGTKHLTTGPAVTPKKAAGKAGLNIQEDVAS